MTITLKLDNTVTSHHLIAVRYDIYIVGGRYVEINDTFKIKIIDKINNESVPIYEYGPIKYRSLDGVRCFYFDIPKTGDYEISFKYFNGLLVKNSMLPMRRLFQNKLDIEQLRIRIERK